MPPRAAFLALAGPLFALGGPLLLGAVGIFCAAPAATPAPPSWDWRRTFASALLYAVAFNVIFFLQELLLVLPKAFVPGLQPTLFHNNHAWEGDDPVARLLQGTGALAIFLTACVCAAWLRWAPPKSAALRLFAIWLTFQGMFQSLPQVVVGAALPANDVGMAMDYLRFSPVVKVIGALAAMAAMALIGTALTRPMLELAQDRTEIDGGGRRTGYILRMATLPALVALPLIILCRVPGSIDQVVIVPVAVAIIGGAWLQASAWFTQAQPAGVAPLHALRAPLIALLIIFAVFQLLLRPGVPFY